MPQTLATKKGKQAKQKQVARTDSEHLFMLLQDAAGAGKLVNLADWYGAFELAVADETGQGRTPADRKRKRKPNTGIRNGKSIRRKGNSRHHSEEPDERDADLEDDELEIERQIMARFVQGVAELGLRGYVGPTKRKPEHVQRLVW